MWVSLRGQWAHSWALLQVSQVPLVSRLPQVSVVLLVPQVSPVVLVSLVSECHGRCTCHWCRWNPGCGGV